MMKKLLVLSLVLAVAGLANASLALEFAIGAGTSPTAGVVSVTGSLAADYPLAVVISDGVLSGFAKGSAAPSATGQNGIASVIFGLNGGELIPVGYEGEGWNVMANDNAEYPKTGTMLTANLALKAMGQKIVEEIVAGGTWIRTFNVFGANVKLYQATEEVPMEAAVANLDYTRDNFVSEIFVPIPEPMTMGLLSLGALFIRKRK